MRSAKRTGANSRKNRRNARLWSASQLDSLESRRLLAFAGDPDTSFNATGWAEEVLSGFAQGLAGAVDTDNSVFVAGQDVNTGQFGVVKFLSTGAHDPTFGTGGVFQTPIFDASIAQDVVIDSDGSVYVAGTFTNSSDEGIFVVKLTSTGTLDASFDGDGIALANDGPTGQQGMEMLVDETNGLAYVAGNSNTDATVVRFLTGTTAEGDSLDTTWGLGGFATNFIGGPASVTGIAQQSNGQIVISAGIGYGVLARLDLTGDLDPSYGTAGVVTPAVDQFSSIESIAIDGLDNVYAVGTSSINFIESIATVRKFDSTGAEVVAFDGDGEAVLDLETSGVNVLGYGIALGGGTAVITGIVQDNNASSVVAFASRFNQVTGALDTVFGDAGVASTEADGLAGGVEVAIDGNGDIVVAGSSYYGMLAARFLGADDIVVVLPVADAGPDQSVNEGQLVNFDGTSSTGTGLSFAWDLDGDGQFDDAFTPTASWTYGDNGPVTVSLQVTDSLNQTDVDTLTVSVANVDPTVNPISGPASPVIRQQEVSFGGSYFDAGSLDTHDVSWDFGDGNVIAYHPATDSGALTPSHTYTTAGNYVVTLNVKDDDGGVGTQTFNMSVVAAGLQGGNLVIGGTNAGETITVRTTTTPGQLKVLFNGVEVGRFIPSGHVIVHAGGGADFVDIGNNVGPTEVYGEAGNDTLKGGNGSDTLDGGLDNDSLDGNAGNDSLVGGEGADTILGGTDNDTSIGGNGNDSITNNGGDDRLEGNAGNDTLIAGGGDDQAYGGADNDSLVGGADNDSLYGEGGNDTIDGSGGDDLIDGGSGNDDLNGGGGADIVVGGLDNDIVQGGTDRDLLIGGDGADSILGNAEEDILIAGMTTSDGSEANLKTILGVWTGAGTYAARRDALLGGLLSLGNLIDDGDVDTLTGGAGTDWFILDTLQDVNDNKAGETETGV